jgi:hypothetical protein
MWSGRRLHVCLPGLTSFGNSEPSCCDAADGVRFSEERDDSQRRTTNSRAGWLTLSGNRRAGRTAATWITGCEPRPRSQQRSPAVASRHSNTKFAAMIASRSPERPRHSLLYTKPTSHRAIDTGRRGADGWIGAQAARTGYFAAGACPSRTGRNADQSQAADDTENRAVAICARPHLGEVRHDGAPAGRAIWGGSSRD